jgi:hypothetical protein
MNLQQYFFTINPVGLTESAANRYVRQVHEHLRWIHRTTSGRILLNCIARPEFPVEIRPHARVECNATGGSELVPLAGAVLTSSSVPRTLRGMVTYTPGYFGHAGVCATTQGANRSGRLFDEILFHELVHVFRTATGKWNQAPALGFGMRQYTDNEEFIAVLCTNIYISDRSNKIKTNLRAGHRGYGAMSATDAKRFALFASSSTALPLIKQFCADHPIFSKAITEQLSDVEYNPIADFLKFPLLCEVFAAFGKHNDRRKHNNALIALGLPAAIAKMITDYAIP